MTPGDDLLKRYQEANAHDTLRPAPALREKVLAQARAAACGPAGASAPDGPTRPTMPPGAGAPSAAWPCSVWPHWWCCSSTAAHPKSAVSRWAKRRVHLPPGWPSPSAKRRRQRWCTRPHRHPLRPHAHRHRPRPHHSLAANPSSHHPPRLPTRRQQNQPHRLQRRSTREPSSAPAAWHAKKPQRHAPCEAPRHPPSPCRPPTLCWPPQRAATSRVRVAPWPEGLT